MVEVEHKKRKTMKKTIIFASVALATLFAFSSCQKENLENNYSENGVRIITATFENNGTKTTLSTEDNKTPLWKEGDIIRVFGTRNDGNQYDDITLAAGNINNSGKTITFTTTLTGILYAVYPASATAMTSCNGSIDFTIPAVQDGTFASANICVAKSTAIDGTNKDNLVFSNATAVLEIKTAANVVGVDITATYNIAGAVTASFSGNEINLTPSLTGKTVSAVCKSAPSGKVFYLAAAPVSTGSTTTATCYKIDKKGSIDKGNKNLQRNVIYSMNLSSMTINTDCNLTGTKGTLNGHEYVIIKAKYDGTNYSYLKWATMNVGATAVTGTASYGTYFAWGATVKAYNAVDYSKTTGAFTFVSSNPYGGIYKNTWNASDGFSWNNTPFTDGVYSNSNKKVFTKYIPSGKTDYWKGTDSPDNKITLDLADDAAAVNWGGTWRMPIGYDATGAGEFNALKDATYWAWDGTDKGYYVFAPDGSHAAGTRVSSTAGLDKGSALLFFPAAGYGDGTSLSSVGSSGRYWSGSLSTGGPSYAYDLYFISSNVYPQYYRYRYYGFSVRPVSASVGQRAAYGYFQGVLSGAFQQEEHLFAGEIRKGLVKESHFALRGGP